MGKVVSKVTGALGLTADPSTGQGAMQGASALQARAVRELEKIGIPEIEAQKLVLEQPELVLSTLEERLGPSAMEDIQTDPRLMDAQMKALDELERAGEEGFTAEDKAKFEAMQGQIGADEKARQATILQQMAQRGALDSGAQLAAQLGSSQAATQRASEQATQMAGQQAAARRNALAQAAQAAGQMQQSQFGQQAQQASAQDRISAFNAAVSARDTAARQQHAQQAAQLANQQQMHNKGLIQQQFQNQMAKATGMSGALGNQAQGMQNQAQMQAQAAQQQAAGTRQLVLGGAGAAMKAFGAPMADGGVKGQKFYNGDIKGRGLGLDRLTSGISGEYVGEDIADPLALSAPPTDTPLNIRGAGDALMDAAMMDSKVKGPQLASANPHDVAAMAGQFMKYADGGMNYESGGEGTIIESGMGDYAGDQLPDRINDGEMVLNLDQQDTIAGLLQELAERRRGDEMVDNGEAVVNEPQQDTLMAIARGEAQPEDLDPEASIVEETGSTASDLESLLGELGGTEEAMSAEGMDEFIDPDFQPLPPDQIPEEFMNGGIRYKAKEGLLAPIQTPYSTEDYLSIPGIEQHQIPLMLPEQQEEADKMREQERLAEDIAQNEEFTRLASLEEGAPVNEPIEIGETTNEPIEIEALKPKKKEDEELKSARRRDAFVDLLNVLDKGLSHYDAANPYANLKPIKGGVAQSDFEKSLKQARKMAEAKTYKDKAMDLKEREVAVKEKGVEQKAEKMSDKDKIKYKSQLKEEADTRKEQRKETKESKESLRNIDEYVKDIDKAIELTKKAQKEGKGRITGPIAGRVPTVSKLGQELEQAYARVSFANFVEKARGMSKAFDSEREREFYEKTQPSEKKDEDINLRNLQEIRKNIMLKRDDLQNKAMQKSSSSEDVSKSGYSDAQERGITKVMEANGVSREEAISALKGAGKL